MAANYERSFQVQREKTKSGLIPIQIVFWESKIEIFEATLNHIRNTSSIILFDQLSKIVKGVQ